MRSFAVLGLGRFGCSLAGSLYETGAEVLVVDKNTELVQEMSDRCTHAIVGDVADEEVLRKIGIGNFDAVIVSIGNGLEPSILTTALVKEIGAKHIIARAQSNIHAKILSAVGADRVVFPELDMGKRYAQVLTKSNYIDLIDLSTENSIIEVVAPDRWVGKTIRNLDIRGKYGVSILAIKEDEKKLNIRINADDVIKAGDVLVMIGNKNDLNRMK